MMTRAQVLTLVCNRCAVEKTLDRFPPHKVGRFGRMTTCRDCRSARRRELYVERRKVMRPGEARPYIMIKVGDRFGKLTAEEFLDRDRWGRARWRFRCDCGGEKVVKGSSVTGGYAVHCGCERNVSQIKPNFGAAVNKIYLRYRANAADRNLTFDLSRDDVSKIIRQPCFYCGDPGSAETGSVNARLRHNGIDRADSSQGYTHENVVPCCTNCNRAKLAMSRADFIALAIRIAAKHGGS